MYTLAKIGSTWRPISPGLTYFIKIRIGYVLKSANVGTLFSRKNSENSLKIHPTHMHTPMHTHANKHTHTPTHHYLFKIHYFFRFEVCPKINVYYIMKHTNLYWKYCLPSGNKSIWLAMVTTYPPLFPPTYHV